MTVNFYLDSKLSEKNEKSIICFIRGIEIKKTLYINTKQKIKPAYWNSDKQNVRIGHPLSAEINNYLSNLKSRITALYLSNDNLQTELNNRTFKDLLLKELYSNPEKEKVKLTLYDIFNKYTEAKRPLLTESSYKKYRVMYTHLKNYEKHYKTTLTFEKMNLEFFDKFLNYGLRVAGHTNNTINKLIKQLKSFLFWSFDRGYHTNIEFKRVKTKEDKVDIVYLTNDELEILNNYDLEDKVRLKNIRDVFCLACYTGARFSDISKLDIMSDLKSDIWYLRTQKTKDIIEIPLNDYALDIINRYKLIGKPLPAITNQKSNVYIKELCKLVGIDTPTKITRYKGAERIEVVKPKYELVSTHTARRTFVTLSLEKGMRPEVVMSITGHNDYKTMKKYIKITSKVKNNEMKNIWKKPQD